MTYRIAVDTGGTFTDVVVADEGGRLVVGKALTTPERSFDGLSEGLKDAARNMGVSYEDLITGTEVLIYGTTRATNAIVTGAIAKTAMLLTEGFPDILVYRQGGKLGAFNLCVDPAEPYIPRRLTFEISERVDSEGEVVVELNEAAARETIARLKGLDIEAVAVCLLWSISNSAHEARIGELIEEILPGVPYTLSHQLNPIIREYPRASSTAIDASLKPLMQRHLRELQEDLETAGYRGELLISTSSGGVVHVDDVFERPILMVKSGPAMAPLAGLSFAQVEKLPEDVLIVDTGGTTFDVSLVRGGEIKYSRETWLGPLYTGHNVGMSSVDVRSVGAGGGSIAWVDSGGLLQVGPQSAGAVPGPACYGQGGTEPTVTDAAVVLGYIDPEHFLNGRMRLDVDAAREAVQKIAQPLGMSPEEAAFAVITIASETMIKAIEEITVNEGVNPRESVLIAGGGAAGLNILTIAKALGCRQVLLPKTAGALTAYGAQYSDIVTEFSASQFSRSDHWDYDLVNRTFDEIKARKDAFSDELRAKGIKQFKSEFFVDARYVNQQYETEIKVPTDHFEGPEDLAKLLTAFNENHQRLYGVSEEDAALECLNWKGRLTASLDKPTPQRVEVAETTTPEASRRTRAYFGEAGHLDAPVYLGAELSAGAEIAGPAVIEEPTTTVVVNPGMRATVSGAGNYLLDVGLEADAAAGGLGEIDPVLLAVMANRMDAILREMTSIIVRTARSSVIGHSRDFSCAIVTADNHVLATAEGLPAHIFGSHLQTRSMCRLHPDFKEGDAYLHNDPYDGNSHAADHTVIVPVFSDDGEHMFSVACKGHQADVGNSVPSTYVPYARDVYEEGALIFPCVKVQENYKEVADIIRMCLRRIRIPDQWYGDHKSAMGAARIAEGRLKDFVRRYGKNRVKQFVQEWFDYSERRAEQSIKKLPKGKLVNHGRHDSIKPFMADGVEIKVEIDIDPDEGYVTVDLRDNPDCVDAGMNLTEATATVYALQGVMHCLDEHVPPNAGSFRRLRVLLRENCVVGIPKFPHSCSVGTTNIGDLVVSVTQSAFTQLGDGYGLSQGNACFGGAMGVLSGTDWRRDHEPYVNEIYLQGGGGPASPANDGMVYLLLPAGAGLLWRDSVEFDEQRFPMFVQCLRLMPDSCGAGRQRGGPATEMTFGPRHAKMMASVMGGCVENPPKGVLGGLDSPPAYIALVRADGGEEQLDNGIMVEMEAGEWLKSFDCGGGGYGNPLDRAPAKVLHDVAERYVSREKARQIYGVIISGAAEDDSLAVDEAGTAALREEQRGS